MVPKPLATVFSASKAKGLHGPNTTPANICPSPIGGPRHCGSPCLSPHTIRVMVIRVTHHFFHCCPGLRLFLKIAMLISHSPAPAPVLCTVLLNV